MFRADQPIATRKDDLLDRHFFARALAEAIVSYQLEDSISIGLFGKWGMGKTSIINMTLEVLDEIPEKEGPVIIRFNPWHFSDQNQLIAHFFSEISQSLCRDDLAEKYQKVGRTIQKYSRFFVPFSYLPGLQVVGQIAKALQDVGSATEEAGKAQEQNLNAIKFELNKLLAEVDSKLLIVIDDIDRLNNTEIRQIFQLVKSLADFPNTVYLLSFDKDIVTNALIKVQEGSGIEYLEKVIQVPLDIPQISISEVQQYFFKKLDELIADVPPEKWDEFHWSNIYHSGLRYMITSLRDVNRYYNLLKFNFGIVQNEVNPVDFMAITAIQVFIPNLYNDIKDNKELFCGKKYSISETDQNRTEMKSRIDKILVKVDQFDQKKLNNFIKILFPGVEDSVLGRSNFESWRRQGRICSYDIFDIYFRLNVPTDEMRFSEIDRILSKGNSVDDFKGELVELLRSSKAIRFLERMEDYTREDISDDKIAPIITALMDVGDQFPDRVGSFFETSTPIRMSRIIFQLLHRVANKKERFAILHDAITKAHNSLYTIVNEIGVQCQEQGRFGYTNKKLGYRENTLDAEHLDKLVQLVVGKIRAWQLDGQLATHSRLLPILYDWRRWDDSEIVDAFVKSLVESDKGLVSFVALFLYEKSIYGMSDYVGRRVREINPKNVETFLDIDVVNQRLQKIKYSELFDILEEREKFGVDAFLDTYAKLGTEVDSNG